MSTVKDLKSALSFYNDNDVIAWDFLDLKTVLDLTDLDISDGEKVINYMHTWGYLLDSEGIFNAIRDMKCEGEL